MARKKNIIETHGWKVRLVLTSIVVLVFCLMFFLGGGLIYFKPMAAIKNFKDLPFEIHFIDVGLGDSIFIRLPNEKTMLIDCGPNEKNNKVVSYLSDLFNAEGIDAIDYLVLTHSDADHVGKATAVFETFQVNALYRPKLSCEYEIKIDKNPNNYRKVDTATYDNVIKAAYNEDGCELIYNEAGLKFFDDSFSVEFLSPNEEKYSSYNNYSPMIMVTYDTVKFLLTGDGETVAENEVIKFHGNELKADVLKVGHHGSSTSTSMPFLEKEQPTYAIISVSEKNKYDFPKEDTISRLASVGATVKKTSDLGTIVMSAKDGQVIECEKHKKILFDIPLLIVLSAMALIIVWGFKIPKKKRKQE